MSAPPFEPTATAHKLREAATAALAACDRICDQYSCVRYGIDFHALGNSLRSALSSPPAGLADEALRADEGWRSIETVPKDGKPVLVYLAKPDGLSRVQLARFHPNVTVIGAQFGFDAPAATHWMPLPEPPSIDTARGEMGEKT